MASSCAPERLEHVIICGGLCLAFPFLMSGSHTFIRAWRRPELSLWTTKEEHDAALDPLEYTCEEVSDEM